MIVFIKYLRRVARFIEDYAEHCRQKGYVALKKEQENNRKAFVQNLNERTKDWEREARRHREALDRIAAARDNAATTYDNEVEAILAKEKQLDLV